jgi:hypothetical protein
MGSNFLILSRNHLDFKKRRSIARRELDQFNRCDPWVVGILSDSFYYASRFRAVEKS